MPTLVLKDANGADQSFLFVGHDKGNAAIFERQSDALIGRARIVLQLAGNTNVNRVKAKLSVPTVSSITPDTGAVARPVVEYTHVASTDISVVAFSNAESRADILAMFRSLLDSSTVANMVTDASLPLC